MLFKIFIAVAIVLMLSGAVIAAPSENFGTILTGALLCWLALPFAWLASKVQHL